MKLHKKFMLIIEIPSYNYCNTTIIFIKEWDRFSVFINYRVKIKTPQSGRSAQRIILLISLLSMLVIVAAAPDTGTILSLTASGGSNPGETITISTTVRADGKIQTSNLYFEIVAPNGAVVDTHLFSAMPTMNTNDTFSYSWTSNNSSYPVQGAYTVRLCWSPGGSQNCLIDSATSTFYSADTLGVMLFVALAIFGGWLWRSRRTVFASVEVIR